MDSDQSPTVFDMELELEDTPTAVRDIFNSYNYIRARVSTHSSKIKKKWAKRWNPKQRSNVLDSIDKEIPVDHRPDIVALRKYAICKRDKSEKIIMPPARNFLWPYISHDDLTLSGQSLLYFLQSRCNNPPASFTVQDLRSAYLGTERGHDNDKTRFVELVDELSNQYVRCPMNFDGAGYGVLSETLPDDEPGPPGSMVLVLLKIQRGIYRFLARLCDIILEAIPFSEDERLNVWTHMVDFFVDEKDEGLPASEYGKINEATMDLSALRIARPYLVDGELNLERLHTFLQNFVTDAEMRVASLKQDPWVFREHIRETKLHRPEHVQGIDDSDRARLAASNVIPEMADLYEHLPPNPSTDELWEISTRQCITSAVEDMLRWNAIEKSLRDIIEAYKEFEDAGRPDAFNVATAAGSLMNIIDPEEWWFPFLFLTQCSRKFRPYFKRLKMPAAVKMSGYTRKYGPAGYILQLDPTAPAPVALFNSLKEDFETFETSTRVIPFHLIEAFMFSVNKVKDQKEYSPYLTNLVENKMTHLFWICDIWLELERFGEPIKTSLTTDQVTFRLETRAVNQEDLWNRLTPLSRAIDKRFRYSRGRVGDAGSVQIRQTSERNLAEFWETFEDQFCKSSGITKRRIYEISKVLKVLTAVIPLRTDDWDESKRPGVRQRKATPAQVKDIVQPIGHLDIGGDERPQTGRAFLGQEILREKEKRRDPPATVALEAEPAVVEAPEPELEPEPEPEPEPLEPEIDMNEEDSDDEEEDEDEDDDEGEEEGAEEEEEVEFVSDDDDDPAGVGEDADDDGRRKVELRSRRDLKVMRDFFKRGHDAPGSISWTAFENAMKSIGFEVQNRGGSAHRFLPTKPIPPNETRTPITLHKGHGARSGREKGIISRRVQEWRMRLTNEYGWTINTFVLAKRDAR